MKRLVWLLLAAWCTALAQVQPVEPLVPAEPSGCCCDCDGTCGMPECVALPAAPSSTAITERPASVARPETRRDARAKAEQLLKFFAIFSAPVEEPVALLTTPDRESRPAGVRLFQEHCALLI
jgi:hypothetical protein